MATYELTYNCTNCKPTENSVTQLVVDGTTANAYVFSAQYGYKFTTDTKLYIHRKNSSGDFYDSAVPNTNILNNGTILDGTLRVNPSKNFPPFSLIIEAVRDNTITLRTLNVTNNIANSVVSYEQTNKNLFNLKVNCEGGFVGIPQITYTNNFGEQTTKNLNVSGNVATFVLNTENDNITLSYKQDEPQKPIPVTYKLSKCVVIGEKPESISLNETLNVTIQADVDATLKEMQIITPDEFGGTNIINGSIDSSGKTGEVSFTPTKEYISYIEVKATATSDEPTLKSYGAINVYEVTFENLEEFAQKRFFTSTDGTNTPVNLGDYVNRIKRIFVDIPTSGTDTIKCGNYDTQINVLTPQTDIITLDFGDITLKGYNVNAHDYETRITLFMPFFGFIDIDPRYIDKTINLKAKINIITGNGIAQISCENVPFHFENMPFSRDVIYRTATEYKDIIGGEKWDELNLLGFEPYVLMSYTETIKTPINETKERVTIGNVKGFSRFDDIEPISTKEMLTDEQKQIYSLLNSGVYVE